MAYVPTPALSAPPAAPRRRVIHWQFARTHPVLAFLMITFGWTWLWWSSAIPLRTDQPLLVTVLVLVGGYGPALGAIFTLGLPGGITFGLSRKQLFILAGAAALIFGLMAVRYLIGQIPGYDPLPTDLSLSWPIIAGAVLTSLVGGWVLASARSNHPQIRARMTSLLPSRMPLGWTMLALGLYPGLLILSWGLATLLGLDVEYPSFWDRSGAQVAPLFVVAFALTALARGGMEEPGWRGVLLPALQERYSPLVASLIIAPLWSLWHLPLYLNGFYADDLLIGMLGGLILRIVLSIILTWFAIRTNGNLALLVCLHTTFNLLPNYLPGSDLAILVLLIVFVVGIAISDRMYRRRPIPAIRPT